MPAYANASICTATLLGMVLFNTGCWATDKTGNLLSSGVTHYHLSPTSAGVSEDGHVVIRADLQARRQRADLWDEPKTRFIIGTPAAVSASIHPLWPEDEADEARHRLHGTLRPSAGPQLQTHWQLVPHSVARVDADPCELPEGLRNIELRTGEIAVAMASRPHADAVIDLQASTFVLPERLARRQAWWTLPVGLTVMPIALVFDVVTLPAQFVIVGIQIDRMHP